MRPSNWIAYALLAVVGVGLWRITLGLTIDEYGRMFTAMGNRIVEFTK